MSLIQPPEAVSTPAAEPAPLADPASVAAAPAASPEAGLSAALAPVDPAAPAASAVAAAPATPPARPEGLPDAFWDAATGVKTTEAVARLVELEAAAAARAADVPADAAGYKLETPEPIVDPITGKAISFNADDPLAKGATAWAHENGVSQAGLSKLLGLFAQNEMAALAAHNAHVAAETAKLGENHAARFTAVSAGLTKHAGEAGAKAILSSLSSADAIIALEAVLKSQTGPAIGAPPAGSGKSAALDGLSDVALLSAVLK